MNTIEKLFSGQSTPISNHPLPFSLALLSPSPAEMPIALKLAPVFPRGSFYLLHPCCAPDLLNLYQNIMPWDLIRWVVRYLDNLIHLSICFVFFFFLWLHPQFMNVPQPGTESEKQPQLTPQLQQHQILITHSAGMGIEPMPPLQQPKPHCNRDKT